MSSFTSYFQCHLQGKLGAGHLVVSAELQPALCSPSYWLPLCQSSAAEWTESGEKHSFHALAYVVT